MTGRRVVVLAVLVAVAQIAFLAWMIQGRASILRNGQEVLLRVMPIDPRDLLRGDYVVMGYEASEFPASLVADLPEDRQTVYGEPMRIRLSKQADGYWMPVAAAFGDTINSPGEPGQVEIKATSTGETTDDSGRKLRAEYGIERFYVPEGEGLDIEKDMGIRPFGILAAVDKAGNAQIKALMDGDKMLYAEPMY